VRTIKKSEAIMDFKLNEEQELLIESLEEFIKREVTEEKIKSWYEDGRNAADFNKAYIEADFGMLGIPEEYGGTPASVTTRMLVAYNLMKLTGAFMPITSGVLTLFDVIEFGTKEQIELCLKIYKEKGVSPFALAISEPVAGSDNSSMTTVARTVGDKIVINGTKTFVSGTVEAPYLLVVAKDEIPDRENKNMSMWLMPMDTPGIKYNKFHKLGQHIHSFCEIYLEDVTIDPSCLVGVKGKGFLQLMQNFEVERILISSQSLALAEAALTDAAKYAEQREQFGQPIYKFQLIAEHLADMEIKVRNMYNMVFYACWKADNGMSLRLDSALLKRFTSKTAFEVADSAMQIMGGIGYTEDCRISRMWKDLRGQRFAGGTDEIMVHIAGREVVKKYSK
jgi:alkylation response protein AidB-like acyl-CoA dehydrogenase